MDGLSAESAAIFRGKEQRRKELAALPFAQKVRAVIQLQCMAATILRERGRTVRPWSPGEPPVVQS